MPPYRYKARDRSGIAVTGVVQAEDQKAVSVSLRELGYQITKKGFSELGAGWLKERG